MQAKLTHFGGGNRFSGLVEHDALNVVADVAAVKDIGDVGQRHHDEASGIGRQRGFDTLLDREERQRVFGVNTMRVAHRNANLPYSAQTLFDQALVTGDEMAGSAR